MKRRIIALLLATVLPLSLVACQSSKNESDPVITDSELEAVTETILNKEYTSEVSEEVANNVYGIIEKHVNEYIQQPEVAEVIEKHTIETIRESVTETIIKEYVADPNAGLTVTQQSEVESLIASAIDNIDFSELTVTMTQEITDSVKKSITSQVKTQVEETLKGMTFKATITESDKVSILSGVNKDIKNLEDDIEDLEDDIADLLKRTPTSTSYTLTDSDVATIKKAVTDSLDIEGIVADQILENGGIDADALKTSITESVMTEIQEEIDAGLKGEDGEDGYTPVKGIDYFTDAEIDEIVELISNTVSSGNSGSGDNSGSGVTQDQLNALKTEILAEITPGLSESEVNTLIQEAIANIAPGLTESEVNELIQAAIEDIEVSDGINGVDGKSAYELAKDGGYTGTLEEWLLSLKGVDGEDGADGKSAYEIAKDGGYAGTVEEWLESLNGTNGTDGKSAYELAKEKGYGGTEDEWLASLEGTDGASAYELAKAGGYNGTVEEWLESLKGIDGTTPVKGVDYFTDAEITALSETILEELTTYVDEIKADLEAKITANANKITALETAKEALEQNVLELSGKIAALETADGSQNDILDEYLTSITKNKDDIASINTQIESIKTTYLDVSTYNTFVSSTNEAISNLQQADAEIQADIELLEGSVTAANNEISALESQHATDISNVNDKYNELSSMLNGISFMYCTQDEYDTMASHDANTLYIIIEEVTE